MEVLWLDASWNKRENDTKSIIYCASHLEVKKMEGK